VKWNLEIWPDTKFGTNVLSDKLLRGSDVDVGHSHNRHDDFRKLFHAFPREFHHSVVVSFPIQPHQRAVLAGVNGVQADGNTVDESDQFGHNIPMIDHVPMAIGIEPHPPSFFLHPPRNLFDNIESNRWLAITAKDNLLKVLRITDGIQYFLNAWFFLYLQVVAFYDRFSLSIAENTICIAANRNIEIERILQFVGDSWGI
jgi:hypothetical protein